MGDQDNQDISPTLMSWMFPEVAQYERGPIWYFGIGLIIVLLAGYGLLSGNFLFALIIILASIIFYLIYRNSHDIECRLTEAGVWVGRKFHPYRDIERFWIIYNPPAVKTLYFRLKHSLIPLSVVSLQDQNPVEVRRILQKYVVEDLEQEDEPTIDSLTRMFKL